MSNSARRIRRRGRKFGRELQERFVARNQELGRLEQERRLRAWDKCCRDANLRVATKWLQHPLDL